jgi:gliding motility-associated-like protein
MKHTFKSLLLIGILLLTAKSGIAQIAVQSPSGWTPQQFLQNVLVLPTPISGVQVTNGTFNTSAAALPTSTTSKIGRFTNGSAFTDFPMSSGIIMTTGNITVTPGPNSQGGASVANNDGTTDAQLQSLTTNSITGMSKLEFDFQSISGMVQFEYSFASEEYPEYTCSNFNDVFGFFITGINPVTLTNMSWNIALIPGTSLPVTINSLNPGVPGSSSGGGTCSGPTESLAYSSFYYSVPTGSTGMQFDGFTYIPADNINAQDNLRSGLFAQARVIYCQSYHMKLAVGNVMDNAYDSGVFIKEGSFRAPSIGINHNYTLESNDTLYKVCNRDTITYTLSKRDPSRAYVFNIYTNSFANPGVTLNQDYEIYYTHPSTHLFTQLTTDEAFFYLPADSLNTYMVIRVPETAVFAPGEVKTLKLLLSMETCWGYKYDTLTYYLKENKPIIISDQVINACELLNAIQIPETGGGDVQHVTWSPTTNINSPDQLVTNCNITDTTVYTVIATDDINCRRDTAIITVNVSDVPQSSFIADKTSGCTPLIVRFTSTTVPTYAYFVFVISNDDGTVSDTLYDPTFTYTFNEPGYYNVTYLSKTADVGNCFDLLENNHYIYVSDFPVADFSYMPTEPTNGRPIEFSNESEGDGITTFYWNFGDGSTAYLENPSHSYHITADETFNVLFRVTNNYNCSHDTLKTIAVVDNYAFYVPNSFTPNNDGTNDLFLPRVADVLKYHLIIYNRYGEAIFQSINPEESWDGTHKMEKCPAGVYTWMIIYRKYAEPDTELRKTGTVMLVR